uniref:Uncharacterized protein n=1 Tax=Panagrolaimus sp. JU765 TaxID=591449 RepID=A0AC34QK20_9BILA
MDQANREISGDSNDCMPEILDLSKKLTTQITFHETVRIGEFTDKTAHLYNDDFELSYKKLPKTHVGKKDWAEIKRSERVLDLLMTRYTPRRMPYKKMDEMAVGYKGACTGEKIGKPAEKKCVSTLASIREDSDNEDAILDSEKTNVPNHRRMPNGSKKHQPMMTPKRDHKDDATQLKHEPKKIKLPKSDSSAQTRKPLFSPLLDSNNGIPLPPGLPLPSPFFNPADYFEMRLARLTTFDWL